MKGAEFRTMNSKWLKASLSLLAVCLIWIFMSLDSANAKGPIERKPGNLAYGTAIKLMDNSANLLLPVNGGTIHDNAVDGDVTTYAQPAGSYAWTLQDDLGMVRHGLNKVVITFAPGLYATAYQVNVSADGTNWTSVANVTGGTGGARVHTFAPMDGRYIRVGATAPNGSGQTGVQMAIAELEVYSVNLATGTTAVLQDNSGGSLSPNSGTQFASLAVDGDLGTYAQAGGSWAWTLHDDLGGIRTGINQVAVTFPSGLFATEYKILLSSNGSSWTEVANVTGVTAGGRYLHTFAPADARYVRVRAVKPDDSGQTGVQMALSDLEVYSGNLAFETEAQLLDNSGNVMAPSSGIHAASNAVDRNLSTMAAASGAWAWTLHDDLGSIRSNVDKVVVTFASGYFPTQYKILLSPDGANWTEVANVASNVSGGRYEHTFTPVDARYVRVRSLKPDGPSQTGVQMGVEELEVYNANLAKGAAALLQDNSGNPLTPNSGVYAAQYAVDGDDSTYAMAGGSWAWTLQNDLGSTKSGVRKVVVTMPRVAHLKEPYATEYYSTDYFATEYQIALSTNGTNWTTVATVTDFEGGRRISEFTPTDARYVRVRAITPNGPEQTGIQMAIAELEIFNTAAATPSFPLEIATTSTPSYSASPDTAIYPIFVDGRPYESWTPEGGLDHFPLKATGGKQPYTWSIVSGSLPNGLSLSSGGKISGRATTEGSFNVTIKVTDSLGANTQKALTLVAEPYRSKWFKDAKFGFMIQWGPFSYPAITTKVGIANFESRITNFDADEWAQSIVDLGGKALNFTVFGGDAIRMWPSTTPSINELKTTRDIVGELITASHERGLKFIAYVPGMFSWSETLNDYSSVDGAWGRLNEGLISELLDKGVDGFWFDSGSAVDRTDWFHWGRITALIRSKNPYATIESNPTVSSGATHARVLNYPSTDIETYEPLASTQESSLRTSLPNTTQKKMAVGVISMLEENWTWRSNSPSSMKSSTALINNIRQNWYDGATVMFNITPDTSGNFIPASELSIVNAVGSWVNANLDWSQTPTASLSDTVDYSSSQSVTLTSEAGASIYYTTDGSTPTTGSTLYTGAIAISTSTRLKAIAVKSGKGNSQVMDKSYVILPNETGFAKLATTSLSPGTGKKGGDGVYVGMKITVGQDPITVYSIGRYFMSGNSGVHKLKIVKLYDNKPVLITNIDMGAGTAEGDGFKYRGIVPVVLEANTAYYLLSMENDADLRWNGTLNQPPQTPVVRIVSPAWSDASGTRYYVEPDLQDTENIFETTNPDMNGQPINIKYTVNYVSNPTNNLALHAGAWFKDNNGSQVKVYPYFMSIDTFAEMANDGSTAVATSPQTYYYWTEQLDLGSVKNGVYKVVTSFGSGLHASDYDVVVSQDGDNWTTAASVTGFSGTTSTAVFTPRDVRYIRLKFLNGPSYVAVSEIQAFNNNLALGTTVQLQDNSGNAIDPDGTNYAKSAIDGFATTYATPVSSVYAWTLHDDLGSVKYGLNKVSVTFAPGLYATQYQILLSTDGSSWTTAATVSGGTGGTAVSTFAPTNARYIRVRALQPSGSGQTGTKMAIAELEAFSANLALGTTAALQDNSGNPLSANSGIHFAHFATDGDPATYAQAGGSWAWTLHDDLGSVKTGLTKIAVTFGPGFYATEYKLLLSANGTSWTEVADVTGASGGRIESTFSATNARYVRVQAIKPDTGPGQPGVQMSVAELEVY